jgi:hypothetical protein
LDFFKQFFQKNEAPKMKEDGFKGKRKMVMKEKYDDNKRIEEEGASGRQWRREKNKFFFLIFYVKK